MINASLMATEFISLLPVNERPEFTEKYEGFFHLVGLNSTVEEASLLYFIRDHDKELFENKKKQIVDAINFLNKKYNNSIFSAEITDQYYNMCEKIKDVFYIVEIAMKAMENVGIEPIIKPIRGGTDGSRLSFMGLPCPNIFAGGHNLHSKYEFVSLETMAKAVHTILNIIAIISEKENNSFKFFYLKKDIFFLFISESFLLKNMQLPKK